MGKAVIEEIINKDLCNNAKVVGEYFVEQIKKLKDKYDFITEIRGRGLLLAIGLSKEIGNQIQEECFKKFLIINAPNKNSLRFMPALNLTTAEVDETIIILESVLKQFA